MRNDLTAEYVRSILAYDQNTGILMWKVSRPPRGKKGQEAGITNGQGSRSIGIRRRMYFAHRLAWLIMTGEWPPAQIDHKNGIPTDNRWENLRAATHSQNKCNQRVNKSNKAGIKGVHKRKDCNRWAAFIQINRKTHYLGLFKTADAAKAAYEQAALRHHGDFAHF